MGNYCSCSDFVGATHYLIQDLIISTQPSDDGKGKNMKMLICVGYHHPFNLVSSHE